MSWLARMRRNRTAMIAAVSAAVTAPAASKKFASPNVLLLFVFVGLVWWVWWEWQREEKGDDKGDAVYYEAQWEGFRSPDRE